MCGRYTLTVTRPELERAFAPIAALPTDRIFAERFNVAPTQEVAVISRPRGGEVQAELMRWGLVPHWASDPDGAVKMINARSETLRERPAYRNLIGSSAGRCLIPADGFYEWEGVKGGPKQPWRFTVDGGKPFAFAGLCATWQPPDDAPLLRSCTVITTEPNSLVSPIHDRMPAILADVELQERWLDPECSGDEACFLLKPLAANRMTTAKAAKAVGKPSNEGQSLLTPDQQELF
jgi:putative SOS response-associated peptidase YedK